MLELIVLGQIPGTQIQLSFSNVMVLLLVAFCTFALIMGGRKYKSTIKTELEIFHIYLSLRLHR